LAFAKRAELLRSGEGKKSNLADKDGAFMLKGAIIAALR